MRPTKFLIAVLLTSCFVIVILYSKLNKTTHDRRQLVEIPSVATTTPFTEDPATATAEIESIEQSKHFPLQPVTVSRSFIDSIPTSHAFWNRKFHSLFRNVDFTGNLTERDLNGTHCWPESTESLHVNIQDFRSYPEIYQDFLQGMDCYNAQILIDQPKKCVPAEGKSEVFLLFAIKSSKSNFERRQAVRDTWGREGLYNGKLVRIVFLLGSTSVDYPNLNNLLNYEAQTYGDLLLWDFQDTFYNLTLKEHVFLKWAVHRCPRVSFIFKGDDDVFANTPAILNYLQSLNPDTASELYTGQIISEASPLRDIKTKYYVPQSFYEGPYPSYAGGGGFLFSGPLLKPLYILSQYIPFFPIDDVYSGMCFKALGISPVKHNGFQTFDIREQDRENACVHKDLLLVHRRNPKQTIKLWRSIHSPLLTC